jgi:hypothetical protein
VRISPLVPRLGRAALIPAPRRPEAAPEEPDLSDAVLDAPAYPETDAPPGPDAPPGADALPKSDAPPLLAPDPVEGAGPGADAARADHARAGRRRQVFRTVLGAVAAVLLYALLRAVGLLTLWAYVEAAHRDLDFWQVLTRFDADSYQSIALRGYDRSIPFTAVGLPATTNLAFFPLFPWLTAVVRDWLVVDIVTAQVVVSWTAGALAAAGLYAVGTRLRSRPTGIVLAGLFAVVPHAVVESMGYSESLFTALAVWSLWAVLRRSWLTAAVLCVLAGLTRPTSAALVAAVGLAALVAVIHRPREWRAWLAMPLAPLGLLGYMWWVGDRLGRWDGYFVVQNQAWKMGFDGGSYSWTTLGTVLTHPVPLAMYVTTALVITGFGLWLIGFGERIPWPLLVYAGVVLGLVLTGAGYYWAKGRLLLPAFPLLIPVALALVRSRNRVLPYVVFALLTALSTLYGVYLLLYWGYSP